MKIVFATNNKNKLAEIKEILGENFEVLSLNDINCHVDIPETGTTLEENAKIKAEYIYNHYGISVFAEEYILHDMPEAKDTTAKLTCANFYMNLKIKRTEKHGSAPL